MMEQERLDKLPKKQELNTTEKKLKLPKEDQDKEERLKLSKKK